MPLIVRSMDFHPQQDDASLGAHSVWVSVWREIERLVTETCAVLGSHLRESALSVRRVHGGRDREAGELTIGRSHLRFECPLRCLPPTAEESALIDVFGARTPLARIFIQRQSGALPPHLVSMLVADPVTGLWIATVPPIGPATLRDPYALEEFFWSLVADRGR